jgi:RNA polymerase sigma factor (sigma-70 family)
MKIMQLCERVTSQPGAVSDGALAQRVLKGDQQAFEQLVQRYSASLFTYICRFLTDTDAASDILQQVWTQLYLSLPTLRTGEPLKGWLFRVAHNRCLDELRRKRAIHFSEIQASGEQDDLSPLDLIPDTSPLPEEVAERHDVQEILQEAIANLPPKFRAVVLLRYTAQLSFAEIAQVLQMPEATAKTYFQRSKPLLRAALRNQFQLTAAG